MAVIPLVSPSPTSFIFDRARSAHAWFAALDVLQTSSTVGYAQIAQNWRMDMRVDSDREAHLDGSDCFPLGKSKNGFEAAIADYFVHYLCRSSTAPPFSAYTESANQGNLIPVAERPARNHRLLHLASVKSLLRHVLKPWVPGKADFEMAVFRLTGFRMPSAPGDTDIEKLVNAL